MKGSVSCCSAIESHFGASHAREDLASYLQNGPEPSTARIAALVRALGIRNASLLDVGSGIGSLAAETAECFHRIMFVDMSSAYLELAAQLAEERGYDDRVQSICADFVNVTEKIPMADVVVLDRVVCCYPDYDELLRAAAEKSATWYMVSYPHDRMYVRLHTAYRNWRRSRKGNRFRTFVHPPPDMRNAIVEENFRLQEQRSSFMWKVDVFRRIEA